jgi:hypothetical protein
LSTTTAPRYFGYWRRNRWAPWQRLVEAPTYDDAWGKLLEAVSTRPVGETLVSQQADLDRGAGKPRRYL